MTYENITRGQRESRLFAGFMTLLFLIGVALIAIGTRLPEEFWKQFLIGSGLACAPSAVIAMVFRFFLIDDVRSVTAPMDDAVRKSIADAVPATLGNLLDRYRQEMDDSDSLQQSGMMRCYPTREEGLTDFLERARDYQGTVTVVGCSLHGTLTQKTSKFGQFLAGRPDSVRFLLTHPAVAELRARQENRRLPIGKDIIRCLRLLSGLEVPPQNISLYIGTPTLFGIMTDHLMLVNPYPYQSNAKDSPCMLIRHEPDTESYIYSALRASHFGLFDSTMTVQLDNLESAVDNLESHLPQYQALTEEVNRLVQL